MMREKVMLISLLLVGGLLLISSCTSNDASLMSPEDEAPFVPITGDVVQEEEIDIDLSELEELEMMLLELEELGLEDFYF